MYYQEDWDNLYTVGKDEHAAGTHCKNEPVYKFRNKNVHCSEWLSIIIGIIVFTVCAMLVFMMITKVTTQKMQEISDYCSENKYACEYDGSYYHKHHRHEYYS